jgi:adenosylhomocysteinase
MKDQAIVCNIGHFDNEIQVDALAGMGASSNTSTSSRRWTSIPSRTATAIYLLAEGRLVNLGCATGHPSFVMSNSSPTRCWRRSTCGKNLEKYTPGVYILPKKLDEEVARLHLSTRSGPS